MTSTPRVRVDALGQVDIVANHNGRRFHGVGLATDIVESSAKAMVHVRTISGAR